MKCSLRADAWRARMAAFRESGLPVSEYCGQNGLPTRRFYYWKMRLSKLDGACPAKTEQDVSPGNWLRIQPETESHHTHRDLLTLRILGAEIELGADFNPALLRSVVK